MDAIPDTSVHCCVTSPPYFGLREYEHEGQIGQEATVAEYVERMVAVFREVRRVLRDDGLVFLHLGDSYANASTSGPQGISGDRASRKFTASGIKPKIELGLKPKDLIGIPWRVAFALQADGWWLRDAIVWAKPNPMPSSVTDRCTSSYEMVFMLAKSRTYYANMDAVREPLGESMVAKIKHGAYKATEYKHDTVKTTAQVSANRVLSDPIALNRIGDQGANRRNVWTIATTPYTGGAHPAVMPRQLATDCILIGCPPDGIVLDPFMGSGTVAECAIGNGRRFVGYEINSEYHNEIASRLGLFGMGTA
ncbi:MAG: site-specific DNA-methyltransferase [Vulcanimicrobiaceae bacterium]